MSNWNFKKPTNLALHTSQACVAVIQFYNENRNLDFHNIKHGIYEK